MKRYILLTAASCMMGLFVHAQTPAGGSQERGLGRLNTEGEEETDSVAPPAPNLPTQKGSSFLGCNILLAQLDAAEFDADKSMHYSVGISPRYGYFLANNFALGADVFANIDGYTRVNSYTVNAGGGIFARYYAGKAADRKGVQNKLRFFVEGGTGYGYLFDRFNSSGGGTSVSGSTDFGVLRVHLMPGLDYFVNRNAAFELGLNYGYQHTVMNEDAMKEDHHSIVLNIGLQFFFCRR